MQFSARSSCLAAGALALAMVAACNSDSDRGEDDVTSLSDVAIADAGADDGSGSGGSDAGLDVRVVNCDGEDGRSPNHTPPSAFDVSPSGVFEAEGFLCAGFDDWYVVTAEPGQRIFAELTLAGPTGNLDLFLYRSGATSSEDDALAASDTTDREESLAWEVDEAGSYLLSVKGNAEAAGAYTLSFVATCRTDGDCATGERCSFTERRCVEDVAPSCGDDAREPNEGPGTAPEAAFGGDGFAFEHGHEICPEDVDMFAVTLTEIESLRIDVDWTGNTNLDLWLYDDTGAIVGAGATDEQRPEIIDGSFLTPGTYYVAVTADEVNAAPSTTYNLTIERRAGVCSDDADCGAITGRQTCEDGACVGYEPSQPGAAGAPCDDGGDCVEGLGCYQGVAGFGDNFCTQVCQDESECGFFGRGATCLPTNNTAVCVGGCDSDLDCPTYYSCVEGACDVQECRVDADCGEGRLCRRTEQQNNGYCTSTPFPGCFDDDELEPNDTEGAAVAFDGEVEGVICEANDDWFVFEVERDGATLEATLEFEGADLDFFIYDDAGRVVAQGASEDVPEVAVAEYLAAGSYTFRVNHFPSEVAGSVAYTLTAETTRGGCEEDADCAELEPLRIVCDERAGACGFLEGDGEVPLGELCDSSDDCSADAEFCWTFEGADDGRNICTVPCQRNSDCNDVPGTECVSFRRFSVCLP